MPSPATYLDSVHSQLLRKSLFQSLVRLLKLVYPISQLYIIGNFLDDINELIRSTDDSVLFGPPTSTTAGHPGNTPFPPRLSIYVVFDGLLTVHNSDIIRHNNAEHTIIINGTLYYDTLVSLLLNVPSIPTSLNFEKLSYVYSGLVLTSGSRSPVIECGVYFGGNTIFMKQVLRLIGDHRKVFSFDTFTGMPEPLEKDTSKTTFYSQGHFSEATYSRTAQILSSFGLFDQNTLIQAELGHSFRHLSIFDGAKFAVLDMDSYQGIYWALRFMSQNASDKFITLIDDVGLHGVDQAINENVQEFSLKRANLTYNLDYVGR